MQQAQQAAGGAQANADALRVRVAEQVARGQRRRDELRAGGAQAQLEEIRLRVEARAAAQAVAPGAPAQDPRVVARVEEYRARRDAERLNAQAAQDARQQLAVAAAARDAAQAAMVSHRFAIISGCSNR
jgi:hypothetical protein